MPKEASSPAARAWEVSCRWLGYRARTEAEIKKRLILAGFDEGVVAEVAARLKEYRYLDDRGLAVAMVEEARRRGLAGRSTLRQRLLKRGIAADLADEVVGEALLEVDEMAEALALADKRQRQLMGLDRQAARRRLAGYLSRRGFSVDTIYRVLERVL